MSGMSENILWIGLNSLSQAEGHSWTDGSPLDYTNWGDGEPNNANNMESCVHEVGNRSAN